MSYQLIVPPDVEREIAEIYDAFDSTDRALSFIKELDVVFDRIAERPLQFPIIHTSVRRALLKHHDHSVFFELDAERRRVVIHAVLHQRRDPARWPR
jgi:plasmid stabilization system protein ParE